MSKSLRAGITFVLICLFGILSPPLVQPEDFIHQVEPGESLYSIARRYGVGITALQSVNNIVDPTKLQVGQRLVIPLSYTARAGDTYYGIARTHNLSVQELLELNGRGVDDVLRVGDVLIVGNTAAEHSETSVGERTNGTGSSSGSSGSAVDGAPAQGTERGSVQPPAAPGAEASATVTLDSRTTVTVTAPQTTGTLLSSQLAEDGSGTTWPLEGERYEFSGKFPGIAIVAPAGTAVRSVTGGRVIYSGPHSTLGQVVFIQHARGYVYIYGGNDTLLVRTGDEVAVGTQIGTLGVTPALQRAQLFFSVWKDGDYLDPRLAPR